jgi:hypothetical protein
MRENDVFGIRIKNLSRIYENWRFGLHGGILA